MDEKPKRRLPSQEELFTAAAVLFLLLTVAWGALYQPSIRDVARRGHPEPNPMVTVHFPESGAGAITSNDESAAARVQAAAAHRQRIAPKRATASRSWATALHDSAADPTGR